MGIAEFLLILMLIRNGKASQSPWTKLGDTFLQVGVTLSNQIGEREPCETNLIS